jgi:hypothetical protein
MIRRALFSIAALLLAAPLSATTSPKPTLNGAYISIPPLHSVTTRTAAGIEADRINIKDSFNGVAGAKGDVLGWADGTMSIGGTTLYSPSATFSPNDCASPNPGCTGAYAKQISNTGSGASGVTQSGTIVGFTDAHHVTTSFTAVQATPFSGFFTATITTPQSGSGSYAPGDTVTLVGGSPVVAATFQVMDTKVVSASVNNAGTGGTNGACVLTGTTGTLRQGVGAVLFSINATISGGAISALGSFVAAGDYTTNPTTLSAEPVTSSCGLTGATLTVYMGALVANARNMGNYPTPPTGTLATTTTGSGTGLTLTPVAGGTTIMGGQFLYGTDDSAAINSAIGVVNALHTLGNQVGIYAPAGNYLIKNNTIATFLSNGGVQGDGAQKSIFTVDPAYVGDVFSWSQGWLGPVSAVFPYNGTTITPSIQNAGPFATNIGIIGDRTAPTQQNAFMLYDENDLVKFDGLDVKYMNGRALCLGCATKNDTKAYTRESQFSNLRFYDDGAPGVPTMEVSCLTVGVADDNSFYKIDIFASYSDGLVIRAGTGCVVGGGNTNFYSVRVEGLAWNPAGVLGDLLRVGDTNSAWGGLVSQMNFSGVDLIDPQQGYVALRVAAPTGAPQPYSMQFDGLLFGGGVPYGGGIEVDAGRGLYFQFTQMASYGTNVTIASSATVGPYITINGEGNEHTYSYNVDPTSYGSVLDSGGVAGLPSALASSAANARINGALSALSTGTYNMAAGPHACGSITTQNSNTCIGSYAGANATSTGNYFIGALAGRYVSTGANESAIGNAALAGVPGNPLTGSNNNAEGSQALGVAQGAAANNTANGRAAGLACTTCTNNLFLGAFVGSTTQATGTGNVLIGTGSAVDTPASASNYEFDLANLVYHNLATTAAPSGFSGCGTGAAVDAHANNVSGTLTMGTGTVTSCVMTLAGSGFTTWDHIRVTPHGTYAGFAYSYSLTALTITGTSLAGDVFDYDTDGY